MTYITPTNDMEFNELMEEVDSVLRRRGVPIYNRPIHAPIEIARKYNISFPLIPIERKAIDGDYAGNSLSSHIQDWYERRYGDRLKASMGIGVGVILIKGEPWKVVYPLIFGTVYFICDPELEKYKKLPSFSTDGTHPVINILNLIENLPQAIAESLTSSDIKEIKKEFLFGLESISYLDQIKQSSLVKEAKADLVSVVIQMMGEPPQFELSKYFSLQFSEKLLKAYLRARGQKFPFKHDLSKLRNLSIDNGLPVFPKTIIDDIQCTPGVRYGEEKVTLMEAVSAHYSSLKVCHIVAKAICCIKGEPCGTLSKG